MKLGDTKNRTQPPHWGEAPPAAPGSQIPKAGPAVRTVMSRPPAVTATCRGVRELSWCSGSSWSLALPKWSPGPGSRVLQGPYSSVQQGAAITQLGEASGPGLVLEAQTGPSQAAERLGQRSPHARRQRRYHGPSHPAHRTHSCRTVVSALQGPLV